jgi:NADPH-dependent ferric siderophore reductase
VGSKRPRWPRRPSSARRASGRRGRGAAGAAGAVEATGADGPVDDVVHRRGVTEEAGNGMGEKNAERAGVSDGRPAAAGGADARAKEPGVLEQRGDAAEERTEGPRPLEKVKYPMRYRVLRAVRVEDASPSVRRIVCAEEGERVDSRGLVGEYVRVVIPPEGSRGLPEPEFKGEKPVWPKPSPPARKYTVRRYDPQSGELEINVVLHERGRGSAWARALEPGDPVHVLGPKAGYRIDEGYDFYLLAGDETGLPGMARWLESMPRGARGRAVLEVPSLRSRQPIDAPEGVSVEWVVREGAASPLAEAVLAGGVPEGEVFMWLAGESGAIRPLRAWMRQGLGLAKGHGYSSGYWKLKER